MGYPIQSSLHNRLLRLMSPEDFELLRPQLDPMTFALADRLAEPNQPVEHVHFPESGLVSQIGATSAGRSLEVGMYGREGAGPSASILQIDQSPFHYVIQGAGSGHRIATGAFVSALDRSPTLQRFLSGYLQSFKVQMAYTALSNGSSVISARLARWLLMCHDRLDGDELTITQEFLGVMLGVRRAGVSQAAQALEATTAIQLSRGRIVVRDRSLLKTAAAGSYGVPEAEYRRLVGSFQ